MSKNIALVTGGAGFIGSHLVRELLNQKFKVRVLDNLSTGRKENIREILPKIEFVKGDIRDVKTAAKALKGITHLFHLAAVSSVPQSVVDPNETFDVNLRGTWTILEQARLAGVRRVVFISSASVYGADAPIPFKETLPLQGSSPYATTKLLGEQLCDLYLRLYGLETVALRLFSVYGPRQNPRSQYANVIPAFATRVLTGVPPTIYGNGRQTRDFIFVGDVAKALIKASTLKNVVGQVINFGSGKQTSINDLLKYVQKSLGTCLVPKYSPLKAGDDPRTLADTTKAKKYLGIKKLTSFDTALKQTCFWFRDHYKG